MKSTRTGRKDLHSYPESFWGFCCLRLGGVSLATDVTVTNTVNGTTYTFKITSTKDKTANVSLSKIGGTDLAKYTASADINLKATYSDGTYTSGDTLYTITSMEAMNGNTTIKTVEMPSTVTSLPSYCFDGCTALTSFSIPGLKEIGNYAFQNCSALTGISIPEGAKVGEGAFQYCTGLKGTLTIPNGANIAYRAFDGCSGIESIVLHSGMTSGDSWHIGCFMSMSGVKSVSIKYDDGKNTIPANVFGGASFSKDGVTLTIPKSITAIGDGAFYHANFPKNLDLSQFTSIGSHAFEGNTTLANNGVTFAEKTTIGASAFENCTALTGELTIPSGASIRTYAFNGCSGVTSLKIHTGTSTSPTTSGESNWYHGCFIEMTGVESVELIDDENGNHTIPANMFGYAKFH